MAEPLAVEDALARVSLLSRLSDRQRGRLASRVTTRAYPAGATIVKQGDTSVSFYVLLSGRARIEHEAAGSTIVVEELGPGGAFGEMGLIDDLPRAATVIAEEPTVCALLARWDFQNELRDDPDIALALLPVLNQRIRDLDARLVRAESVRE
jgi:CRP/FNR family transcriptional regulator, cyclic AMP receptor protein